MELTQMNSTPRCLRSEKVSSRNHMACAGLQICHDDAVFLRDRFFDQDIVGKLWLDAYLDGLWKEPRHSVILVVEV